MGTPREATRLSGSGILFDKPNEQGVFPVFPGAITRRSVHRFGVSVCKA
jgi:hypothetical protein